MPAEITLTSADDGVFLRLPREWSDENLVACEIAAVLHTTSGDVLRRVARFIKVGLVERRGGTTITAKTEIRRIRTRDAG